MVIIVTRRDRENGTSDVLISDGEFRCRVMVSTALLDSGEAHDTLQIILNRNKAESERLRAIHTRVGED